MMTCREVSTTVAAGQVQNQSVAGRMQIWMHIAICGSCRRFSQQIRALDQSVSAWLRTIESETPPDLEQRVTSRLVETPGGPKF